MSAPPIEAETLAVLLPAHCAQEALDATVRSVAAADRPCQVSLMIVDDGSPVALTVSPDLLQGMPATVIRLAKNQGIERALNAGLDVLFRLAPDYIARIDIGDRMTIDRLVRQVSLMRSDASVGVVGSNVDFVDGTGNRVFRLEVPTNDWDIRRGMHISSCLSHPSVLIRGSIFREVGHYSLKFPAAEDYDLLFRIIKRSCAASIPEALTISVLDPAGISLSKRWRQLKSKLKVQLAHFDWRITTSYLGVITTVTLMLLPNRWILAAKHWRGSSRY